MQEKSIKRFLKLYYFNFYKITFEFASLSTNKYTKAKFISKIRCKLGFVPLYSKPVTSKMCCLLPT